MKSPAFVDSPGGNSPRRRVAFPHLLGIAAIAVGCSHIGGDQVLMPVVVGMTEMTAPVVMSQQNSIYEVHLPVQFPLRQPKANEMTKRIMTDFTPQPVWLEAHDFQIELRYTISNLTDSKQNVEILVDPWNEFVKYKPGITITEEDAIPDRSGFDRTFVVKPKEKLQGTITNDDTLEMATDLATVMNIQQKVMAPAMGMTGGPNLNGMFNNAFDLQNRSSTADTLDPLISKYIPKVVPGLTGCDIGFRMNNAASVALEVIVDIVDLKMDRVIGPGEVPPAKVPLDPPATVLSPPAAPVN